jgi:hypothetical protein
VWFNPKDIPSQTEHEPKCFMSIYHGNKREMSLKERLDTFKQSQWIATSWPMRLSTPLKLAEAGFMYTGVGDLMYCPSCEYLTKQPSHLPDCTFTTKGTKRKRTTTTITKSECRICYSSTAPVSAVLDYCGHAFCMDCAVKFKICPICRCEITKIVQLFK